jgi:hypothetical protein
VCVTSSNLTNSSNKHVEIADPDEQYSGNGEDSRSNLEENAENPDENGEDFRGFGPYIMQEETRQGNPVLAQNSVPNWNSSSASASRSGQNHNNGAEPIMQPQQSTELDPTAALLPVPMRMVSTSHVLSPGLMWAGQSESIRVSAPNQISDPCSSNESAQDFVSDQDLGMGSFVNHNGVTSDRCVTT